MTLDVTCTDMFCGAGGSTTGATQAGATVKMAINHWDRAIETHNRNYPDTVHVQTDLHKANPRRFPRSTILLGSPECTNQTIAKGKRRKGQPELPWDDSPDLSDAAEERSRCTMWTPLDWAECHKYEAVILENVVEAHEWAPFPAWLQAWKLLGYDYELVFFNSMHAHPTPQSRDRMYFVAWKKGNTRPNLAITPLAACLKCDKNVKAVQSWKNPGKRWGKYKQQYVYCCPHCASIVTPYYYTAATAIDWSLPAQRIGDRKKPLQPNTTERITYGLEKFTQRPQPSTKTAEQLSKLLREAFPTHTLANGLAQVAPPSLLMQLSHHGNHTGRIVPTEQAPFVTQTTRDDMAVITLPFLLDHLGEYRPRPIDGPCSTICAGGEHHSLITPPMWSWLMTYYQHGQVLSTQEAIPTVTTLDRHALLTNDTQTLPIAVEDCGFRMLVPSEIQAAMAFPQEYVVTGSRKEQVKQLGNATTPPVIKKLVGAVLESLSA